VRRSADAERYGLQGLIIIIMLVWPAGIVKAAPFLEMSEDDFDAVLAVNLKGVFLTCQAAAQQMVQQGRGGSIITMSSVSGCYQHVITCQCQV
jgi:NAD(P)-dependent dehydrogenase (short-subunit alcohol dehydrogenase family)